MFPIIKLDWAYLVTKDMISHRHMRLCKYKFETYNDWVLQMKKGNTSKYYGIMNTKIDFVSHICGDTIDIL